jgi:hypothetical protein
VIAAAGGPALAVRPFVTDDSRITDPGQIQGETWLEGARAGADGVAAYNVLASTSINDWLEFAASVGAGLETGGRLTLPNPSLQAKFLFSRPRPRAVPGLAVSLGTILPFGRGALHDEARGAYLIAPVTSVFGDGWLTVHGNFGVTAAWPRDEGARFRPYWGLGAEVQVGHPALRVIGEAFAGDPLEALGPPVGAQFGVRWLYKDTLNFDLAVGVAPGRDPQGRRTDDRQWSAQLGIRFLFDVWTPEGVSGDPLGAPGLFGPER